MALPVLHHHVHPRPRPRGRPQPDHPIRSQRGQVLPLVLVAIVLAGVLAAGLVRLGVAVAQGQAAQAAADAAALAGAARGEAAAREVAAANGAEVVAYRTDGADVEVTVLRRGHRRTARARWVPDGRPPAARRPLSDRGHVPVPGGPGR